MQLAGTRARSAPAGLRQRFQFQQQLVAAILPGRDRSSGSAVHKPNTCSHWRFNNVVLLLTFISTRVSEQCCLCCHVSFALLQPMTHSIFCCLLVARPEFMICCQLVNELVLNEQIIKPLHVSYSFAASSRVMSDSRLATSKFTRHQSTVVAAQPCQAAQRRSVIDVEKMLRIARPRGRRVRTLLQRLNCVSVQSMAMIQSGADISNSSTLWIGVPFLTRQC